MKINIYATAFALILSVTAFGQLDRSKFPEPGPAPEINLGKPATFELSNGLKVFVVENRKLPRVSFSLIVDREPIFEGEKAGYVGIAGQLLRSATTNRSQDQLNEEVDFLGANLTTSSTSIFASSLKKHTGKVLDLMTDVLYNPAFPEDEFEKIKKRTISNLQAEKDDPNAIAGNVLGVVLYGKDHPYGEISTEKTIENITVEDCKNYYNTYFKPNTSYLVVVGDVTKKEAQKLVKKYFSKWEKGEVPKPIYSVPSQPEKTKVVLVDRPSAVQSLIRIAYPVQFKPGADDAIKASIMNGILGGGVFSNRLIQNIRETHGYTYSSFSALGSDKLVGRFISGASVRNEVTDSALYEFMYELKRIGDEPVDAEELSVTKNFQTGSFARGLESPQTIANYALNIERFGLADDYYQNYLTNLSTVSIEDVQSVAKKYIKPENAYIVIVGKASEIAPKLEKFGEIEYRDIYGEVYTPATSDAIPAGLTAESVIDKYLKAIGGKEKVSALEDLITVLGAEVQGFQIELSLIQKAPNLFKQETKAGGGVVQSSTYDGKKGVSIVQGQRISLDDNQALEQGILNSIVPELTFSNDGIELELSGIERVNGKDAYAINITLPTGSVATYYYDKSSGLKVKTVTTQKTPQGEIQIPRELLDYKEVEGIMFPHTSVSQLAFGKITAKVTEIKVNSGVDDSLFVVE